MIFQESLLPLIVEQPLQHLVTTRDLPFFTTGFPPIGQPDAPIDVPALGTAFGTGAFYKISHAFGVTAISSSYPDSTPIESWHKILRYRLDNDLPDPPPAEWEGVLIVLLSETAHPQADLSTINTWLEDADIPISVEEEEFAEEELEYADVLYPYEEAGSRSWAEVEVEQLVRRKNQTISPKIPSASFHGVLWDQVEDPLPLPIPMQSGFGEDIVPWLYLSKTIETIENGTYFWTQTNSEAGGLLLPNASPVNRQQRFRRSLSGGDPFITLSGMGYTASDVVYDYSDPFRSLVSVVGDAHTTWLTTDNMEIVTPVDADLDEIVVAATVDQIEERNRYVIVLLHAGCLAFNRLLNYNTQQDWQQRVDRVRDINNYLAHLIEYKNCNGQ